MLAACKDNITEEKNKILALLQMERKAHFEKNAALFVSELADTILSVNKGITKQQSKQEMQAQMQRYFDAVEFVKWDDIAAPVIQFSNDVSMAYASIQKEIIVREKSNPQQAQQDTIIYSWVSIYKKLNSNWKLVCNISTNK